MKKIFLILAIVLSLAAVGFLVGRAMYLRLTVGREFDTWVCSQDKWVRQGFPKGSKPDFPCGSEVQWKEQEFVTDGLSLVFSIPENAEFREEIEDDGRTVKTANFWVEIGTSDDISYRLHAVYQPQEEANEETLENSKSAMDPESVKDVTIAGHPGIEGVVDPDNPDGRYLTVIRKDTRMLFLSTSPVTPENKLMTDRILETLEFR